MQSMKYLVLFLSSVAVWTVASAQISVVPEDEPWDGASVLGVNSGDRSAADGPQACREIEQEVRLLEKSIRVHQQALEKATSDMTLAGTDIAASASQRSAGSALGGGLQAGVSVLSMVPGMGSFGSLAGGIAAGAATAALSGTQSTSASSQAAQGALGMAMEAQQALYREEARHQYLVGVFLDRRCTLQ